MDLSKLQLDELIVKRASSGQNLDELLVSIKKLNSGSDFVQIFDPEKVINRTHIVGAYANSLIAFENKANKTGSMAMEMLLFVAMTDQIGKALLAVGAKTGADFVLFASSKSSFGKIGGLLKDVQDFKPGAKHIKETAKVFGIDFNGNYKELDAFILQKIAISSLGSD